MDIFVEPVLPKPKLLILGASPVAVALATLAPQMGFAVTVAAPAGRTRPLRRTCAKLEGFAAAAGRGRGAFVVVSTQGAGDRAALKAAAAMPARYRAFVGSRRKAETLRGNSPPRASRPTGWPPSRRLPGSTSRAITSEEIALSILAEMIAARRRAQQAPAAHPRRRAHE